MSAITRRAVLAGAPAVAAVAAMPAIPALAGADDAALDPILPLYNQWCDVRAQAADISARAKAAEKMIPADVCAALDAYPYWAAAPQALQDAYKRHVKACGIEALDEAGDVLYGRQNDLECRIMKTPAVTPQGLLAKAGVAMRIHTDDSDGDEPPLDDGPMLRSMCQDLERLAGGAA